MNSDIRRIEPTHADRNLGTQLTSVSELHYHLISLSGGGYRAALYHAGVLRALHAAEFFDRENVIVNSVSGGAIPAIIWREFTSTQKGRKEETWPETTLLDLVESSPIVGGRFNWQLLGGWFFAQNCWRRHIERWWDRHEFTGDVIKESPIFLIEVLDYYSGKFWVFHEKILYIANREFFRRHRSWPEISLSPIDALTSATALPGAFTGLRLNGRLFKDAGIADNLALLPLLEVLIHNPHGDRLGNVACWFLSNAGKPLSVLSSLDFPPGNSETVESLGVEDRLLRLTGDLAQPLYVNALAALLEDYAKIKEVGVSIGRPPDDEESWLKSSLPKSFRPSSVPTALISMPKTNALGIMAEGAQAASFRLCDYGFMSVDQRSKLQSFYQEFSEMQLGKSI